MEPFHRLIPRALFAAVVLAAAGAANAATVWDEGVNGNLSASGAAPTPITLAVGTNSVIGTVGGARVQGWIGITVPAGDVLSSYVLESYSSTDAQGFTGVGAGTTFTASATNPASYLGYAHFGTGATNGSIPATNVIGMDLLPLMGNNTIAAGSAGFSTPLPSGNYVFLVQQLGATTNYQFDFGVSAVPEPATASLLAIAGAALLLRRRKTNRA